MHDSIKLDMVRVVPATKTLRHIHKEAEPSVVWQHIGDGFRTNRAYLTFSHPGAAHHSSTA